jgi:rhodanese-related sulfurtransferase
MTLKKPPLSMASPRSSSWTRPSGRTFRQAWDLFVFSAFFAVLFNAFYSDGIELRPRSAKTPKSRAVVDRPTEPAAYSGWKRPSVKPSPAKPTPVPPPSDNITRLSHVGAKARFDKKTIFFLDARKPEEYQQGHIPGALNFYAMEMDKFAPRVMPQLTDKSREIIVYCGGGDCTLSLELAQTLIAQGYQKVGVFEGGWPDWKKAGYPVNVGENP